jgi:hypothetical protein
MCDNGNRAKVARSSAGPLYTKSWSAANNRGGAGCARSASPPGRGWCTYEMQVASSCSVHKGDVSLGDMQARRAAETGGSRGFYAMQGIVGYGMRLARRTTPFRSRSGIEDDPSDWARILKAGIIVCVVGPSHGSNGAGRAIHTSRCAGTTSRLNTSSSVSRRRMTEARSPVTSIVAGRGMALKLLMETSW